MRPKSAGVWRRSTKIDAYNSGVEQPRIAAEANASIAGIRAGDVQLIGGNTLSFIQDSDHLLVLFPGIAKDIGDYNQIFLLRQLGQLFLNKGPGPDIL